jgi:hypothetical protein
VKRACKFRKRRATIGSVRWLAAVAVIGMGCHAREERSAVTIPTASASAHPAPVARGATSAAVAVREGAEAHFKNGARGTVGDVTFTVHLLPKLIVSGPEPEIEQADLDVERGADRSTVHLDTRHKTAEWGGWVFQLGYADVYHDDVELTVRRK